MHLSSSLVRAGAVTASALALGLAAGLQPAAAAVTAISTVPAAPVSRVIVVRPVTVTQRVVYPQTYYGNGGSPYQYTGATTGYAVPYTYTAPVAYGSPYGYNAPVAYGSPYGYAAPYGYNTGYNTGCNAGQMLAVPVIGAAAGILAGQTPTAALLSSLTSTSSLCPAQAAVAPYGYGSPYGTAQSPYGYTQSPYGYASSPYGYGTSCVNGYNGSNGYPYGTASTSQALLVPVISAVAGMLTGQSPTAAALSGLTTALPGAVSATCPQTAGYGYPQAYPNYGYSNAYPYANNGYGNAYPYANYSNYQPYANYQPYGYSQPVAYPVYNITRNVTRFYNIDRKSVV